MTQQSYSVQPKPGSGAPRNSNRLEATKRLLGLHMCSVYLMQRRGKVGFLVAVYFTYSDDG